MKGIDAKMAMGVRAQELIEALKAKPEVMGILVHGGFSSNPRHDTDWSSDLDLTVVTDGRACPSWHNFKHYEVLGSRWLEVDLYNFDLTNTTEWDAGTREGYAYSSDVVFDRTGKVSQWVKSHCEMSLEFRENQIRKLLAKALALLGVSGYSVDEDIILARVVKLLVEVVFYINWEYPPDLKWRVSGSNVLNWKPAEFTTLLGRCNQTADSKTREVSILALANAIRQKLAEEGMQVYPSELPEPAEPSRLQLARLFTRIDKYSAHSVRKCVMRGLPWNAHDIVSEGIDNVLDIIFYLNGVRPPKFGKFTAIDGLRWQPRGYQQYVVQSSIVVNYEDGEDAIRRAEALRKIFAEVKAKINEEGMFETVSLYDETFMAQDLFGENSPYTLVYKYGGYINRSAPTDSFADSICKLPGLTPYEKNVLFGMCNHYLVGTIKEFLALDRAKMEAPYIPVWEKVVSML